MSSAEDSTSTEPSVELRAEQVGHDYGGATVLDRVDLRVDGSTSLGIIGESGSGKSTLLRLLAGIEAPRRGRITLDGQDITAGPGHRLLRQRVQLMFQDPSGAFDPRMRLGRSIAEPLRARWRPRLEQTEQERLVGEALERVGLDADLAGRYPHQLSGGQRQRVALARAVVSRPSILLADEPVSALDVAARARVLNLLQELTGAGTPHCTMGLVLVTHDLSVVRHSCDQLLVLQHGRVVEAGPTVQVLDDPQHEFTRRLVAARPGHLASGVEKG